ncbi:hypothetical protein [uncultured Streptomyces sp.]|uniref:hypothetical protein n=1 Tax=uncultured Streptomyces sp. TaxID=174707 RepID=UPI002620F1BD|nr:hypothetical protein [uncultured Streptomyces sp.]
MDMVVEITDPEALTGAALESIAAEYDGTPADGTLPEDALPEGGLPGGGAEDDGATEEGRRHAEAMVREDGAEALAALVDPFDLIGGVPGIELAEASWSSEVIDHDGEADHDDGADDYDE